MYQDNKSQLIWCQVIHCFLFLFMGSLFAFMYAETAHDEQCNSTDLCIDNVYMGCKFQKQNQINQPLCDTTEYSVQNKFEAIFEFGIFTYFLDALFRFIVVLGLKYNQLWVQIAGIVLTVIVSTFL